MMVELKQWCADGEPRGVKPPNFYELLQKVDHTVEI